VNPRNTAWVRVTHWISALSFLVLVLSGIAMITARVPTSTPAPPSAGLSALWRERGRSAP
jgi:Ni,Fe-hydrogenase I cytochrome b subunit